MEITKTAFEYSRGSLNSIKKNWKSLLLLLLFAFGMLLGTYILKQNLDFTNITLSNIFNDYISSRKDQSIAGNFIDSIKINMFFILITFILGLCAVGTPIIALIPIIKGIGMGLICGYLYLKYNFSGLGYCVLTIYPGVIVYMFSLITACSFSMSFSYDILLCVLGKNKKDSEGECHLKLFCIRYAIILILSILSSIIDAFTIKLFSGLFSF